MRVKLFPAVRHTKRWKIPGVKKALLRAIFFPAQKNIFSSLGKKQPPKDTLKRGKGD